MTSQKGKKRSRTGKPKPRPAWNLNLTDRQKDNGTLYTCWYTGTTCGCGAPIATNGQTQWCCGAEHD